MAGNVQTADVCLYVGEPIQGERGLWHYWKRSTVEVPRGSAWRHTGFGDFADRWRGALYREVPAENFSRAVDVDERQKEDWSKVAEQLRQRFEYDARYLIETLERVTPDHLICRVWTSGDNPPELCIGDKGWELISSLHWTLFSRKREGKRAYLSFDCVGLWEIQSVLPPVAEREPIRIEIVRRSGLVFSGLESVLEQGGLAFIADERVRATLEADIRKLERDFDTDRDKQVILACGHAADTLMHEVGKQHLKAGKNFGGGTGGFDKLETFAKASLDKRTEAFFGEFKASEHAGEFERFRAPLDSMRHWSNFARHAGKADKHLVEPDGFTVATCYGAVRDFIRLLQAVHRRSPKLLCPDPVPVPVTQAATP
ncbi:MAG: hypothetical protein DPW14_04530 [Planctomycetes bacterium]|nr:hypothetical protein [Planctomycetota bacterium]